MVTPAEAWRALEETSNAVNALRNAAFGRGVVPPSVPAEAEPLRAQIGALQEQFGAWRAQLGALDAVAPTWGSELAEWRERYQELARAWSSATGRSVIWLSPVQGIGQGVADGAAAVGRSILVPVLLAAGLAIVIFAPREPKQVRA